MIKKEYIEVCLFLFKEDYDSYKEKVTKKIQDNIIIKN